MTRLARGRLAVVFLFYLGLAGIATWPLASRIGSDVIGLGDVATLPAATPPLNIWAMAAVLHNLPRQPFDLFDANAFYPYKRSLALSEHLFLPALTAAPAVAISGNWVLAYNLLMLATLATAGLGMFLLCRELTGDALAALAGGVLYAFHTWNINELVRSQITANQWFPFVMLALLRFARAPSARRAWLVALSVLLQSLSCMYWALYLPFLVLSLGVYLAWRARLGVRELTPLLLPLALAAAALLPFVWAYAAVTRELGLERGVPPSVPVDRYFDVLPTNLYAGWLGTANRNQNAAHFLGFLALGLGALGAARGREAGNPRLRPFLIGLAAAGFLLSLGPEISWGRSPHWPGPYSLLRAFVPGFHNVRYPERFSIFVVLGLAPLVALGAARVGERFGSAAEWAIVGLVFLEHLAIPQPTYALPAGERIPSVYRWLAGQGDVEVTAELPSTPFLMERGDALPMYFSTVHWKRTLQGYTSYFPPAYNLFKWRLLQFPADASVGFLGRLGVDAIVVSPAQGRLPAWAGADPRWRAVGPFPEGHLVLRLPAASPRAAFAAAPARDDLAEIERSGWVLEASGPGAPRAIDGDPRSAWSTRREQRAGDYFRIRFPRESLVARIAFEIRSETLRQSYEFPMHLGLRVKASGQEWQALAYDADAAYEWLAASLLRDGPRARFVADVAPTPARALELRISDDDPFEMPWSIAELHLYAAPAAVR